MKKILGLLLFTTIFLFTSPVIHAAITEYKSEEYGISFTVPATWRQEPLLKERESLKVKYANSNGSYIMFGYYDIWEAMPDADKNGFTRSDFNSSLFTIEDMRIASERLGYKILSIDTRTINGIEYFNIAYKYSGIAMRSYILYNNGIEYSFIFNYVDTNSSANKAYESFLSSIKYDDINKFSSNTNMFKSIFGIPINFSNQSLAIAVVSSFLLTFLIYCGPVLVYRFAIKKAPLPAKEAKKLTIIFGIVMVVIVIIFGTLAGDSSPGGAVFFYSMINYYILKSGKTKKNLDSLKNKIEPKIEDGVDIIINDEKLGIEANYQTEKNNNIKEQIVYCINCGKQNRNTDNFCKYCGFKLQKLMGEGENEEMDDMSI